MAKLYYFPQGKEKKKIKKQIRKNKNAPILAKRKTTALNFFKKLFFFIRAFIGVFCDVVFSMIVGLCRGVIYLTVVLGGFFLLIKYNTNGGVWDGSMWLVIFMLVLGSLGDVSGWCLFQRLMGTYSGSEKSNPPDND
ncbi:hypothetical protein [Morganella morganii]|uniref:hypothetical protein n=2 Tax=Enterobacterales TaxID=91347 RepID=UPI0031380BCA